MKAFFVDSLFPLNALNVRGMAPCRPCPTQTPTMTLSPVAAREFVLTMGEGGLYHASA